MALRTLWSPVFAALSLMLLDGAAKAPASTLVAAPLARSVDPTQAALLAARMPLRFEANAGQWDEDVRFVARRGSTQLVLRDSGAMLSAGGSALRLTPAGGRTVEPVPSKLLTTKSNYFLGDDPSKHRTDVANYGTVTYPNVQDGVDLVYRGEDGQIEYDFVVQKGVDVAQVAMNVEGAEGLSLTPEGDLLVQTAEGPMLQSRPRVFQRDADGKEVDVKSSYRIVGPRSVGFEIAAYDRERDLVIDPTLAYAAYIGATTGTDAAFGVALDAQGNTYLVGQTAGANFPGSAGSAQPALGGGIDAYLLKLTSGNGAPVSVAYATYIGGSGTDIARAVRVDAAGNAYVGGYVDTNAGTFPTTPGVLKASPATNQDGFVVKVAAAGNALTYATLLGGANTDRVWALDIDGAGNAYVTGSTNTALVFATDGAVGQTLTSQDAFVTKINPTGTALVYSSYLGNTGNEIGYGIAVDSQNRIITVGYTPNNTFPAVNPIKACAGTGGEGFIARINPAKVGEDQLEASGCYGGSLEDQIRGVALDSTDRVFIVGDTLSTDLNVTRPLPYGGLRDMFVARVNLDLAQTNALSYLGGDGNDFATGIAVSANGTTFVSGYSSSSNYPTQYPLAGFARSTNEDAVVTKLSASATLIYSTYVGNTGNERANAIAVDAAGTAHVAGQSSNALVFPTASYPTFGTRNGTDCIFFKLATPGPTVNQAPIGIIPPKGSATLTFAGNGDLAATLTANASNGTLVAASATTSTYTAGANGDVTDVVTATDGEGGARTFNIQVGPGVTLSPANPAVPPHGTVDLDAAGGSGTGYVFSFVNNVSGGTIVAATGEYTAGALSGADVIKAVDSLQNEGTIQVAVGDGIAVTPAVPTAPPRGSIDFAAIGGSNAGFVWSMVANPSGGSISADGDYVAGTIPSVTDRVKVVDSLTNERVVDITVGPGVTVNPTTQTIAGGTLLTLTATGGNGVYTWSAFALPSGGNIDAASGLYSAGVLPNTVTDVLTATDSLGNSGNATITVTGTDDVPDGGGSSSSSSSSSSSGSTSSSSGNTNTSSSSGETPSGSSGNTSSGNTNTGSSSGSDAPSDGGGDEGGGCSTGGHDGNSAFGSVAFALGMMAMLRRKRAR